MNFYFASRITVGVVAGLRTVLTVECRYCYSYRPGPWWGEEEEVSSPFPSLTCHWRAQSRWRWGDTQLPASWVAALFNMHHFHRDGVAKYCTSSAAYLWATHWSGGLHYIYHFVLVHTRAVGIIGWWSCQSLLESIFPSIISGTVRIVRPSGCPGGGAVFPQLSRWCCGNYEINTCLIIP